MAFAKHPHGPSRRSEQAPAGGRPVSSTRRAPRLGTELRAAREARHWSTRRLADLAGVSQSAVSRLERDLAVSWSTLSAVLAHLPEIDPREALGQRRAGPPASNARTWRWFARAHGSSSERGVLDLELLPDGRFQASFELTGLVPIQGSLADPIERVRLVGAVILDEEEVLEQLEDTLVDGPPPRLEIDAATGRHELEIPTDDDGPGIRYRWSCAAPLNVGEPLPGDPALPVPASAGLWLAHPCRRLVLRLSLHGERREVWPWAQPPTIVGDLDAARRTWRQLHPNSPERLREGVNGRHELEVDHPSTGFVVGLDWSAEVASPNSEAVDERPPRIALLRQRRIGRVLKQARRREGLSLRAVSRRAGVPASNVSRIESGRQEPGVEVVRAIALALPGLSPFELLPPSRHREEATLEQVWHGQADAFGVEVDEERREVIVTERGELDITARTIGVRWLREGPAPPIRFGLGRPWDVVGKRTLEEVTVRGDASARVRVVERQAGVVVHDLRSSLQGVSWRRRLHVAPADDATYDATEPSSEGRFSGVMTLPPVAPTRRLVIRVDFPAGRPTARPHAHARPSGCPALIGGGDVSQRVHRQGWSFRVSRGGCRLTLRVELPLVGLGYSVGWGLRDG